AETGLAGAYGEVEAEFPKRVAGAFVGERILLRIVVRVEEQVALDPEHVERGEAARDDAHLLAFGKDAVPDDAGVLAAAEDLVAALAGVAGARDHDRQAEELR